MTKGTMNKMLKEVVNANTNKILRSTLAKQKGDKNKIKVKESKKELALKELRLFNNEISSIVCILLAKH